MTDYAFPGSSQHGQREFGMTLRDYFAAKALEAQIARLPIGGWEAVSISELAELSFDIADLMLEARSK